MILSFVTPESEIDAWYDHLHGKGVPIFRPLGTSERIGVRGFMVSDPEGYTLEFESFIDPLVIMVSVPLSMIGALLALKWSGGEMKKIPPLDGPLSTALAVNRLGHVVGTSGADADHHSAYLQDKTGVHALPAIPKTSLMTPRAINGVDAVVGTMMTPAGRDAVFFSDEGKSYWLYGLLDTSGEAWSSLSQAWGINQGGQIVGVGFFIGEGNVPFIATPVAP